MGNRTKLVIGSLVLAALGFSPILLSVINKGNKKGELEFNPRYYESPDEEFFVTKEASESKSNKRDLQNE